MACWRRNSSVNRQSTRHPLPTFAPGFWRGEALRRRRTDPTDLTLRFPQRAQPDHFSHYITLRTTRAATDDKSLMCTFSVFVTLVYHHVALFGPFFFCHNHVKPISPWPGIRRQRVKHLSNRPDGHYLLVRKQYRFTVHSIRICLIINGS